MNKKNFSFFIVFFLSFILSSCNKYNDSDIVGWWYHDSSSIGSPAYVIETYNEDHSYKVQGIEGSLKNHKKNKISDALVWRGVWSLEGDSLKITYTEPNQVNGHFEHYKIISLTDTMKLENTKSVDVFLKFDHVTTKESTLIGKTEEDAEKWMIERSKM